MVSHPAAAQRRVALVIGNGAYANVPRLNNPVNDAALIETMLKAAGFDTVFRANDLGALQMRRALRDFGAEVRDADVAVLFCAGHGIEIGGINYLIPVDAVLERDSDVVDEAIPLDRINLTLEPAKRLRLIILDACRDNPFARSMQRTLAGRSIGRGLAPVEVATTDTLIAYAAKAGSTAADGEVANSPYTLALTKHLATPGLDVRLALGRVRDEVLQATSRRQEPFLYGSLGGSELPLVRSPIPAAPLASPGASAPPVASEAANGAAASIRICREVEQVTSLTTLAVLERQHRGTPAADCISARMDELKAEQALAESERRGGTASKAGTQPSASQSSSSVEASRRKAEEARQKAAEARTRVATIPKPSLPNAASITALLVNVGDTIEQVKLTYPAAADTGIGDLALPLDGIRFFFGKTDKILENIRVDAPFIGSVRDVRIGMAASDVVAKLGQPSYTREGIYFYRTEGMTVRFDLGKTGQVETIFQLLDRSTRSPR